MVRSRLRLKEKQKRGASAHQSRQPLRQHCDSQSPNTGFISPHRVRSVVPSCKAGMHEIGGRGSWENRLGRGSKSPRSENESMILRRLLTWQFVFEKSGLQSTPMSTIPCGFQEQFQPPIPCTYNNCNSTLYFIDPSPHLLRRVLLVINILL